MNPRILKIIFRGGIPLVFFMFVFTIINPKDIVTAVKQADGLWIGIGCSSVLMTNYLSSLRTGELLFENSQPLIKLWHIHGLRAMITGALPFSTGELSFVYYLKKFCVTPVTEGLAILIYVRFLEFFMFLCLLFMLVVVGVIIEPSPLNWIAFGIITLNLAAILLIIFRTRDVARLVTFFSDTFLDRFMGKETKNLINEKIQGFSHAIKRVISSDKRGKPVCLTFAIVLLRNVFVLSMIKAMGVSIGVWFIVYLFIFLFLTRFIQGFGSFGNQEVGITGALMLMGYARDKALAIAIGTHLLQWFPVLILGCFAYVALHISE